jgi:hypothetical protein
MCRAFQLLPTLLALAGLFAIDAARGAETSVAPGINDRYATPEGRKTSLQIFEGEGRDQYQKPEEADAASDLRRPEIERQARDRGLLPSPE